MTRLVDKAKADYDEQNWPDTGCEFADTCLNDCDRPKELCPLWNPRALQHDSKTRQDEKIMTRINHGWTNEQIRADLKISESTIARAKARDKKATVEYLKWESIGWEEGEVSIIQARGRIKFEKEAARRYRAAGLTVRKIAEEMHLCLRTAFNRLKGD